jgi:hypothetical protein
VLPVSIATPAPLPRVVIAEVRADPLGREPAQEYVELLNAGTETVSLASMRLSDQLAAEGDPLPDVRLSPGARVLVVADDFDPDDDRDTPRIPAGALLARIGASLGEGGLSASGEPLILRHVEGARVHRIDTTDPAHGPSGECLVRQGGVEHTRLVSGPCTPGVE